MRVIVQRVRQARVEVDGQVTGAIAQGLLVFIGIRRDDTETDAEYLVEKISSLRVFHDENGKMNRDVRQAGGALLLVSQFTLYGDCSRGRRPSFDDAAPAAEARLLYEYFVARARQTGIPVETGVFQAMMSVHLENDGPVTLLCESPKKS
ncbi:MAG: D-tyrosyl-tRNA(Tyr) deacylase [Acidobacteria bacterium]|nr:D-tyrosyl-tRNA(Tyr) deacylase [Acidobacteriota bacterium]